MNPSWTGKKKHDGETPEEKPRTEASNISSCRTRRSSQSGRMGKCPFFGHQEWDGHEKIRTFSEAKQIKLSRAMVSLQTRREQAELAGNWGKTATYTRAMAEVQSSGGIALAWWLW